MTLKKSDILELFKKLRPVKWKYNNKKDLGNKTHFGFIAQDLLKLGEEYAFVDTSEEYLKVNYTEFIGILTSVVQSQQDEINILREEINRLKERL